MENKKNSDEQLNEIETSLLQYINATTSAGNRARTVIIVMLVASVYVFTQVRNADGWLDRRIEVRVNALRLFKNFDKDKVALPGEPKDPPPAGENRDRAQAFINRGYRIDNYDDYTRLQTQTQSLIRMRDEQLRLVRLPFFGAAFDANDMGIFAGITFTVVLFWLFLTIHVERSNLQTTFRVAEAQGSLRHCYNLLAMQQVLSVPPTMANKLWRPFGYISKLLYLMPLGVYIWLFHHDSETQDSGYILGWDHMTHLMRTSKVCLVLIFIFTTLCLVISFLKDREWTKYTEKIKSLPLT
ncbi:MAG: hypothetical protein H7Y30_03240 [Pyrinomonadaceae bacterium]|nr:hypothetical protein [Pyrinomonadaceae bacterium]